MKSLVEMWKERVEAHHAQSNRARGDSPPPTDFWRPFSSAFRDDPSRTDDLVLNRLTRDVSADSTVLDVGGGAGRYALPLALRCRHVTVVDPSESMLEALRQVAQATGIKNITSLHRAWEEAVVRPADIVFCAHVLYGVADIAPFIGKLNAHAKEQVLILAFVESPQSYLTPLWRWVHGEERITLPGLPDLMAVLWEMGLHPDLEMLQTSPPRSYETLEEPLDEFRRRLYVQPGTGKDELLQEGLGKLLDKTRDGYVIRDSTPRRLGLVSWHTRRGET